jgi:ketosteroid isomerase-like protein
MRAWLETFPPLQHFTITADEIVGCDDMAFVRGSYAMTLRPEPGAAPQVDRGHYLGLMRRQTNGSWLWSTDMAVSELPAQR